MFFEHFLEHCHAHQGCIFFQEKSHEKGDVRTFSTIKSHKGGYIQKPYEYRTILQSKAYWKTINMKKNMHLIYKKGIWHAPLPATSDFSISTRGTGKKQSNTWPHIAVDTQST